MDRAIQYAAAYPLKHNRLWNTGPHARVMTSNELSKPTRHPEFE
jgi:hypothetical protein